MIHVSGLLFIQQNDNFGIVYDTVRKMAVSQIPFQTYDECQRRIHTCGIAVDEYHHKVICKAFTDNRYLNIMEMKALITFILMVRNTPDK